jgi:hypothetical protein
LLATVFNILNMPQIPVETIKKIEYHCIFKPDLNFMLAMLYTSLHDITIKFVAMLTVC